MVTCLEHIHSCGWIHGDVKPDNILLSLNPKQDNMIYLIDFGYSERYVSPSTNKHKKMKEVSRLKGNPRFMSVNTNNLYQQSRRDDLESLAYTMVYLTCWKLPWTEIDYPPNEVGFT